MKDKPRFGLIGGKLSHSFSPQIHSFFGNYEYNLYPLPEIELASWFKNNDLNGFNVTIPYKKIAYSLCDELSEKARKIGSVNTVIKKDGKLYGDNTDYFGFKYLLSKLDIDVKNKVIMILGSGGSAKTVQTVMNDLDAKKIVIISRTGKDNYSNIYNNSDTQIIVNTTPVGMFPHNGDTPLDPAQFPNCEAIFDLIYNPSKTRLIQLAEKNNIKCINGLPMLVAQGKAASEIFTGMAIDDSVIDYVCSQVEKMTMNIVLIGMPGSGKTSCGREIAKRLNREFIDTDVEIEKMTGRTPENILNENGENIFRQIETSVLSECCKKSSTIIASGGGIVTVKENLDILKQNSTIVFLDRSPSLLDRTGRPLSKNLDALYEARYPLYREFADIVVKADGSILEVSNAILAEWRKR